MKTPLAAAFVLFAFPANAQMAVNPSCLMPSGSISRVAETQLAEIQSNAPSGQLGCKQFLSTTAVVRPSRSVHA